MLEFKFYHMADKMTLLIYTFCKGPSDPFRCFYQHFKSYLFMGEVWCVHNTITIQLLGDTYVCIERVLGNVFLKGFLKDPLHLNTN